MYSPQKVASKNLLRLISQQLFLFKVVILFWQLEHFAMSEEEKIRKCSWLLVFCFLGFAICQPAQDSEDRLQGGFLSLGISIAQADAKYWVTSDRLNRRTCPAVHCGIVGQLFHREGATVYEQKDGWARVSKRYDASCRNGRSEYVDSGDNKCSVSNGIKDGKFAEWVFLEHLSEIRPPDPGAGATGMAKAISQSDDFRHYESAFVTAAEKLVSSGRCTLVEIGNNGGWTKSTTTYRNKPVYFMYCGGMTLSNRLYLNADTGQIFQ